MKGQLGQLEINKVGWQPSFLSAAATECRLCCSLALFFHFIVAPVVQWAGALWGFHLPVLEFDMDSLLFILGRRSNGSLRTYEKQKGLTKRYS